MTPRQSGSVAHARGHRMAFPFAHCCARGGAIVFLCLLALGTVSCAKHKVLVLPLTFNPSMTATPDAMEPPQIHADLAEAEPVALVIPPPRPTRPVVRHSEAPAPLSTEPASPKPVPPRISLRLSPAEESSYRQRTSQAIAVAEKNLQSVNSSTLSVAQQDLVEKIRGFLSQSREAIRSGDWLRAHNLAQKAQVLSEELISLK